MKTLRALKAGFAEYRKQRKPQIIGGVAYRRSTDQALARAVDAFVKALG
jgi:hypothetical protein